MNANKVYGAHSVFYRDVLYSSFATGRTSVALCLQGDCSESLGPYAAVLDQQLMKGFGWYFPECFAVSKASVSPSKEFSFTLKTSPALRMSLLSLFESASLNLLPSTTQQT